MPNQTIGSQRSSGSFNPDLAAVPSSINAACGVWLDSAAMDVWNMARFLVSGVLLRRVTGRLYNSIFRIVDRESLTAQVGTANPYGIIWELYGMQGPITSGQMTVSSKPNAVPKHKPIVIMKSVSAKGGALGSTIRFRQATYTRTSYKPPVRFLATALELQMTGAVGRQRLRNLGNAVGLVIAKRYVSLILGRYSPEVVVKYT